MYKSWLVNASYSKANNTDILGETGDDDAEAPLQAWHDIVIKAQWLSPQDVKNQF